jgi:ComF family protein
MKKLISGLLSLLFPPHCIICKQELEYDSREYLCPKCLNDFKYLKGPFCTMCGKPLPAEKQTFAKTCRLCQKMPPEFDCGFSVCIYDGVLKECIHRFKYQKKTFLKSTFGKMVSGFIKENLKDKIFDCIVPVPLHPARKWERGFNQAELIAMEVRKLLDIPVKTNILKRKRWTQPQVILSKEQRRRNVKNAFYAKNDNRTKNVILLDDVMTTGATLNECAKALKTSNIEYVCAITIARTI